VFWGGSEYLHPGFRPQRNHGKPFPTPYRQAKLGAILTPLRDAHNQGVKYARRGKEHGR